MSVGSCLLIIPCIPAYVFGWALGILFMCTGVAHNPRIDGHGVLSLEWREWLDRRCRWSISLPKLICFKQGLRGRDRIRTETARHEHVHDRQLQDNMLTAGALALGVVGAGQLVLGCAIWCSGVLWLLIPYLTAALRYGPAHSYRGAEHERSAYAQTTRRWFTKSWIELEHRE